MWTEKLYITISLCRFLYPVLTIIKMYEKILFN